MVVRLTAAAMSDLRLLDPQAMRWALKKMLLLERNPEAGEPLRGSLIGFRKIIVGDRHWRVVWRVTHDAVGLAILDVAEVWAVGARSDFDVYTEMDARIASLKGRPETIPLAEALESLGSAARGLNAQAEPDTEATQIPDWLSQVLITVVGMPAEQVEKLLPEEAERLWTAYTNRPR
ncbi:type II toxin-antitoxin system RelE family toxin [Occultella kanbiaonis]|uniref:type II toxin-antitoxin system RelE family toxin n=1 Tax=Occultella kanbiaonis TaxID=2675754 RepID=UPI0013CF6FE1|nr:type II toxin-antitoxin system RelE/ParE family toxin [Occultella kanbiaonis]